MACFPASCVGFIWDSISPAVKSILQFLASEAVTWFRNGGAERILQAPLCDSRLENSRRSILGVRDVLSNFRNLLDDDDCDIIGIYGMGGIGKTALLQEINNESFGARSGRFNLVIFIPLYKDIPVDLIQKKILDRLGLDKESSDSKDRIFNALRQKKFLLLLDNLWDKLDLGEIGVPFSPNSRKGSKIAFTTRSAEVCNDMGAARWKLKMPLLSPESSWELFCQNQGTREDQWSEFTRDLAKRVASKCEGLPLALITVGRSMADVTDTHEWEAALEMLGAGPGKLRNMEEEVLRRLKFSYDRLREERHKKCLLYCSLFREGFNILIRDLIEYWVGEGLLEEGDRPCSIDEARNCGSRVIAVLKAACLLQDGSEKGREVKLHDVVRKMALWITSGKCEEEKTVCLVNSGDGLDRAPKPERWTVSTRISLMWNRISELPERLHCENLRTLLLRENPPLCQIQGGVFQYMRILTVLDLSHRGLKLLPPEISLLVELRFLDLSWTQLESLPREVGGLTKLRRLNLSCTFNLHRIPQEAISSLSSLQSLNTFEGVYYWTGGWKGDDDDGAERCVCLKDLAGLTQLDELGLEIAGMSQEDMHALLDSRRVCSVMRYLCLEMLENLSSLELCEFFGATKNMRELTIDDCVNLNQLIFPANQLRELEALKLLSLPLQTISWKNGSALVRQPTKGASFKNLLSLDIQNCAAIQEITWIRELPCLESLFLLKCPKMVEMIVVDESTMKGVDEARDSFFPKLRTIQLWMMDNLESICGWPLLFPTLQYVQAIGCPWLKKLPFGLNSAKNIKSIVGDDRWQKDLEWDNEDIRSKFISYFVLSTEVRR